MDDLDKLDRFFDSDDRPDESIALSDFDGFLDGVACTPEPSDNWLEIGLGIREGVPGEILRLAVVRLESIRERLTNGRPTEPVFWRAKEGHVIAMDWREGFKEAVKVRPEIWERFSQTPNDAKLLLPIMVHTLDDHGNSLLGIAQEDLDETLALAADAISANLAAVCREIRNL